MIRTKLQYLYSILVLSGVLVSSYLMFEQQPHRLPGYRNQQGVSYRAEANLVEPGLEQLLQFESQFKALQPQPTSESVLKRQLSETALKKSEEKKKHKK